LSIWQSTFLARKLVYMQVWREFLIGNQASTIGGAQISELILRTPSHASHADPFEANGMPLTFTYDSVH